MTFLRASVGPLPGGCPKEPQGHLSSALSGGQTLASPPSFLASVSVPAYQAPNNRPAYLLRPVIREYKGKHWDVAMHCTPGQCLTSVTSVSSLIDWRLKFPPPHASLGVNVLTPRRVFLRGKMLVIRTATPLSSETAVSGLVGRVLVAVAAPGQAALVAPALDPGGWALRAAAAFVSGWPRTEPPGPGLAWDKVLPPPRPARHWPGPAPVPASTLPGPASPGL